MRTRSPLLYAHGVLRRALRRMRSLPIMVTPRQAVNNAGSSFDRFGGATMASRRDFLKTTGGLVLATGGAWAAGACPRRRFAARSARASPRHACLVAARRAAGKGAAHQEELAAAEFRDAALLLQRSFHAERRVLRPLSPVEHSGSRGGNVAAQGRRRGRGRAVRAFTRAVEARFRASRGRRGLPMLGKPARDVSAARSGRRMGIGRDGQRPLEGCAPEGRAGEGRRSRRKRSRSSSTAPMGARSPARPTSSSRFRSGRRSTRTRSSPMR